MLIEIGGEKYNWVLTSYGYMYSLEHESGCMHACSKFNKFTYHSIYIAMSSRPSLLAFFYFEAHIGGYIVSNMNLNNYATM